MYISYIGPTITLSAIINTAVSIYCGSLWYSPLKIMREHTEIIIRLEYTKLIHWLPAPLLQPDGWAVWGVVVSTRWWLLVDHCVLRNWDRILVRAVKGINFSAWHGLDLSHYCDKDTLNSNKPTCSIIGNIHAPYLDWCMTRCMMIIEYKCKFCLILCHLIIMPMVNQPRNQTMSWHDLTHIDNIIFVQHSMNAIIWHY